VRCDGTCARETYLVLLAQVLFGDSALLESLMRKMGVLTICAHRDTSACRRSQRMDYVDYDALVVGILDLLRYNRSSACRRRFALIAGGLWLEIPLTLSLHHSCAPTDQVFLLRLFVGLDSRRRLQWRFVYNDSQVFFSSS